MNLEDIKWYNLRDLNKLNILIWKNWCWKSTLLREIETGLREDSSNGLITYISPERWWILRYDSGVENAISRNKEWTTNERRKNGVINFRQQTISQYRKLELIVWREFQENQSNSKFTEIVKIINDLLSNIELTIDKSKEIFEIVDKETRSIIPSDKISSWESELISLAVECLVFEKAVDKSKKNFLFLDEPDVHLHPDLQVKLMDFLTEILVRNKCIYILISTHSTAIIWAFEEYSAARICFMKSKEKTLAFEQISKKYKRILPIFWAHPLTNIFNKYPILILEWLDDVRIWQQVMRSSQWEIKIYPIEAWSISEMNEVEKDANKIISAIYDWWIWYSIRDKDESKSESISNKWSIIRFKLSCRNAENFILTDEFFKKSNITWESLVNNIEDWLQHQESLSKNRKNIYFNSMKKFKEKWFDRKNYCLKEIRHILIWMITNKPWEVIVGQSIAENISTAKSKINSKNSIFNFLWKEIVESLLIKKIR